MKIRNLVSAVWVGSIMTAFGETDWAPGQKAACLGEASTGNVARVFLPERFRSGDVNVRLVQAIDRAAWIWYPGTDRDAAGFRGASAQFKAGWDGQRFVRFVRTFATSGEAPLQFDVSADERFVLLLDGRLIARGPNRSTVNHWGYQTYRVALAPGSHTMEAVVWAIGPFAPYAQLTWRGGFILKAEGAYDGLLTTGKADWKVATLKGTVMRNARFGIGADAEIRGTSFLNEQPAADAFVKPEVVRSPVVDTGYGSRTVGWKLEPSALPDQLETFCQPGRICAGRVGAKPGTAYQAADEKSPWIESFQKLLKAGQAVTLPAHTSLTVLWDLDDYYCAYPELQVAGGAGATIRWGWEESLWNAQKIKGNRNEFRGKTFAGHTDTFRLDGRANAHFTTPWWRCGRWCELAIETAAEPLTVTSCGLIESRYPTPPTGLFVCDDPTLVDVQKICVRGLQMCMHEMFFDCPYYEQQMYPGDTRVQLLTVGALNSDDRLIRHAIDLLSYSQHDDGLIAFNFPTWGPQEGAMYSMIWAFMLRDYMLWHENVDWLRARMLPLRALLDGLAAYENREGLLENLPGWSFVDWVPDWQNGVAPDGSFGQGVSAINNLLYGYALRCAAEVESALGEPRLAARLTDHANALGQRIVARFWSEERGLLADTVKQNRFSEHAQCLALLMPGVLSPAQAQRAFAGLLTANDLARTTVYFSHYLFETYGRFGHPELILKRFDLWRNYVKMGLRTPLESPGDTARSDCHAWGSHPLYHLQTVIAGITPAEPFFKSVRIAPQPGPLKHIAATMPHPKGLIQTDLSFEGERVAGTITLPAGVDGSWVWKGKVAPLHAGKQEVKN